MNQATKNATKILTGQRTREEAIKIVVKNVNNKGCARGHTLNRSIKYFTGLVEGKIKSQAALDAGFTESSARNPAHNIERFSEFQNAKAEFSKEMQKQGITIDSMTSALKEMLDRRSSVFVAGKEKIGKQIDATSANMAINSISRILGLYSPEKKAVIVADLREVEGMDERELDEELKKMITEE